MPTAVLHSAPSSPHVGGIEFGPTRRQGHGWAGSVSVTFDGDEWTIDIDMIDPFVVDMVGFFEEIAADDWVGVTQWASEFSEVDLRATNLDNGNVKLEFHFWWEGGPSLDNERDGWLWVRADELPKFATQVRELTGLRGPAGRFRAAH